MKEAIKRGIIVGLGVIFQIAITLIIYMFLIDKLFIINIIFILLKVVIVIGLIKNSKNYSATLPWIVIILVFPVIGTLMYIIIDQNKNNSKLLNKIVKSENNSKKYLKQDKSIREKFKDNSKLKYISDFAGFPVTENNNISYYPLGEQAFKEMIKELKKAEKFIFLEYFIINHGTMWDSILEILKEKVKQGVDVRVMYDDAGCIATLKKYYYKELEKVGIKCVAFNKLKPFSGVIMNNRDHRKILVIDGRVAFSGGINLSDEYININSPHGHWKDNAIKIEGEAVWSYTVMFLTMWNAFIQEDDDFSKFKYSFDNSIGSNGFAVPYSETPLDNELTGEDIYLNIINQAHDYVYIFTPYLIIDTDMINTLTLAAKRGVDVRIVIPGIPDKKIVYTLSESYLELLVKSGVKMYKYTPGFVHSKVFVSDDHVATVGTINLDYRSLYLHFECGIYLENVGCIKDIKKDLVDTINKSHKINEKEAVPKFLKAVWQTILRLFAPLM